MKKPRKQSDLQKICLQYGKDCWQINNSAQLAKFLKQHGQPDAARAVEAAIATAKYVAKDKYFRNRKKLQPAWKDWSEQFKEENQDE